MKHVDILRQGTEPWNEWRRQHPNIRPDLRSVDLQRRDLSDVNLSAADLESSDFTYTFLTNADLSDANLAHARLIETNLVRADLRRANLIEAMIHGANLRDAKLGNAVLTRAYLGGASLVATDMTHADLVGADLTYARLIETTLVDADITDSRVYGISAWNLHVDSLKQKNLRISRDNEPIITVDDLEVAQFIYLLINHEKLRNVIDSITKRGVLILGRFGGGGLDVLRSIAAKLRDLEYLPIIFDFDRPAGRDYTETVKTVVGLSRFVIVDLSGPSVPQELYATVPHFKIPFVPIIEKGTKVFSMFSDLLGYDWVLKPVVEFANVEELIDLLPTRIVAPAEERHKERQRILQMIFAS
jgi:hypothetical protein